MFLVRQCRRWRLAVFQSMFSNLTTYITLYWTRAAVSCSANGYMSGGSDWVIPHQPPLHQQQPDCSQPPSPTSPIQVVYTCSYPTPYTSSTSTPSTPPPIHHAMHHTMHPSMHGAACPSPYTQSYPTWHVPIGTTWYCCSSMCSSILVLSLQLHLYFYDENKT